MIATVRQISQATGIAVSGTLYGVFQARHQTELLATGLTSEAAASQAASLSFQEVLTFMVVTLVAAIIVSALRGRDRPRSSTPSRPDEPPTPAPERQQSSLPQR
jgi:hypothetical protein